MQRLFDERFIGDLFGDEGVNALRSTIATNRTPDRYLSLQRPYLVTTRLGRLAVGLAQRVEPIDRTLGSDEESRRFAEAFRDGALLAIGGLQKLLGNDRIRRILETSSESLQIDGGNDDDLDRAHQAGQTVLEWGMEGYALADAYHGWFESVEDEIADVRHQIAAKSGFGMLFYLAALATYAEDAADAAESRAAIEDTLATLDEGAGGSWDDALEALLASEPN